MCISWSAHDYLSDCDNVIKQQTIQFLMLYTNRSIPVFNIVVDNHAAILGPT
jgi:hypothetical protein